MNKITLLEKIYFDKDLLYLIFDGDIEFEAGHALGIEKNGVKRYYSVASAPSDDVITFVVHLVPGGKMSTIFDNANLGDKWDVVDTVGKFSIEHLKKAAVLTAGTGIAPFRSLYREALHRDIDIDVIHIHSSRFYHQIPFLGEWERYVKFIPTITRDPNFPGEKGRIDLEKIKRLIPDYTDRTFLICGSVQFVATMIKYLRELEINDFVVEGW